MISHFLRDLEFVFRIKYRDYERCVISPNSPLQYLEKGGLETLDIVHEFISWISV